MRDNEKICKEWYNKSYHNQGFTAQRFYPNEELCRFLGREYFNLPLNKRSNLKILEIGCGTCSNLWMIAKEGFQTFGIDLSNEAIDLGKKMLIKWNVNADLKVGSMCNLPYEKDFFNVVIDIFSSNCLVENDFIICLKEIVRVLKVGGKFFSYTPSTNSDAYINYLPSKKLDKYTLDGIRRKTSPYYGNNYPFRFISPERYKEILKSVGLKVTYFETISKTYRNMTEKFEFVTIVGEKT